MLLTTDSLKRLAPQDWIPYSRLALAAAETIRINQPGSHQAFSAAIFRAYCAIGKDIGD